MYTIPAENLLADQFEHHKDAHDTTSSSHSDAHSSSAHDSHDLSNVPKEQVFEHLLGELGDHHGLYWGPYHIADLPHMVYTNGTEFYYYPNTKALLESGKFTFDKKHQIISTATQEKPWFDLSITNLVFYQWVVMLIVFFVLITAGRKAKKAKGDAPKGIHNLIEVVAVYIRDEVVMQNVGSKKVGERLMPYFLGLFFFILGANLFGLLPGMHTYTGAIGVTAALAITAFVIINLTAIKEAGIKAWLHHLLGGAPAWLAPIMIPIEIVGLITKPFALTVRLFANMTAGHIILLSLVGLILFFKSLVWAPIAVSFSVFIYFLELLVAFLQAYIFTLLTAVFIGLALGDHAHEEHAHH